MPEPNVALAAVESLEPDRVDPAATSRARSGQSTITRPEGSASVVSEASPSRWVSASAKAITSSAVTCAKFSRRAQGGGRRLDAPLANVRHTIRCFPHAANLNENDDNMYKKKIIKK